MLKPHSCAMPTLYLTHPGAVLRYENDCFVAEAKGQPSVAVPRFKVERVVAFGAVHITQPALARLLAKRVEVHFLSRFGLPKGMLCPADDSRVDVRLAQYRAFCDEAFRLGVARSIVAAKVANCRQIVMRFRRNHPGDELNRIVEEMKRRVNDAAGAQSLDRLLGIEGAAAALYFDAYGQMIGDPELFDGRSRRPPRDPANALLSLGYTLLGGEVAGLLSAHGLDPYLGFYHQARRGLPALAQDVLEEFRAPVVDRLVLALLNRRDIQQSDFAGGPEGGFRLKQTALKQFLGRYEDAVNEIFVMKNGSRTSFRRLIAVQAQSMRHACEKNAAYQPFHWERG